MTEFLLRIDELRSYNRRPMLTFSLSVLALLIGPVIYAWGRGQPTTRQLLDGFILATVAGIVCVYIIPDAISAGGTLAVLFLAVGLVFPVAIEKAFRHSVRQAHVFIVVLAAAGLVSHALIDGIALLPAVGSGYSDGTNPGIASSIIDNRLALAVILHRLPVGMAIWWSVRPAFGAVAAVTTFVLVILATAAAFFWGAPIAELAEQRSVACFQAFVAGSLVHVVAFGVSHEHGEGEDVGRRFVAWGFRAGILLGMFVIAALPLLG